MFDFPATIEVDKIPAEYRICYDEQGAFLESASHIRDAIIGLDKTVTNLRAEASRNKKNSNETITAVNTLLSELGVDDLEALTAHITGLNETIAAKGKINPDKIREEVENGFKKQIMTLNETIAQGSLLLNNTVLGRDVAEAVAKHGGNADLLSPFVRTQLEMVEENGAMQVRVKDKDGDYIGDGKGGWLTVESFVGSLKENPTYHGAFAARQTGPGGGGTPPNNPPGSKTADGKPIEKTPGQKIASGLAARGMGQPQQKQAGAQTPPGMD